MLLQHFTKHNRRNVASTLLNILGMAVAFAAMYIILVQVHHDLSYNRAVKDSERIFVVSMPDWYEEGRYMTWLNRPPHEQMIASFPQVEAGGTGYLYGSDIEVFPGEDGNSGKLPLKCTSFSEGAVRVFGFEAVAGSFKDVTNGSTFAVSESAARRFGLSVGSSFQYRTSGNNGKGRKIPGTVAAIYKDMPRNSDLASFDLFYNIGKENLENWSEWSYPYYVKLRSPSDRRPYEEQADAWYEKMLRDEQSEGSSGEEFAAALKRNRVHLVPLRETYFDKRVSSPGASGNRTTTFTLLAIAVLVILIAFIHYVNFFFALVPMRMRSVNTRKVLGCSRGQLIGDSIRESVGVVLVSLVLGAVVVRLFSQSSYSGLISCSAAFGRNPGVAVFVALLALALSVAASLHPAWYLTSFQPALALKGAFAFSRSGKGLRDILIGFQFVISIALIVCVAFIHIQRNYMMRYDMGFNGERLLVVTTTNTVAAAAEACESRLKANPMVADVTWANGDIVQPGRMGWGREQNGKNIYFQCYPVAWDFLRFMGIGIVEGRDFTPADEQAENGVFIFNEATKKEFGITLESKIEGHTVEPAEIAGFCRDFNFTSLKESVSPFCLYVFGKNPWRRMTTLFVRTAEGADVLSVMEDMKATLTALDPSVTADDLDIQFFDRKLQATYSKEKNLSTLVTLFTFIAIVISLMGVFGLVLFETEYRRKEIGIRKVNGATVRDILLMFNRHFIRIVLLSFTLAAPVSFLIVRYYLRSFAYRTDVRAWVFGAALLAVLAVTVGVVTLRSLHAARTNPVEELKKE